MTDSGARELLVRLWLTAELVGPLRPDLQNLHVLSYVDADPYRRDIKRTRNLQEQRHGLAKHVFHGRKGELYKSYQGWRTSSVRSA